MGQGNHPKGTGMPAAEGPSTIILFPSFSRASSRCVFVCSQLLETRVPSRDRGLSPSSALSSVIGHKKLIIRPESHFPFLKRPSLKRVFFWQKGLPAGKPAARVLLQQGLLECCCNRVLGSAKIIRSTILYRRMFGKSRRAIPPPLSGAH